MGFIESAQQIHVSEPYGKFSEQDWAERQADSFLMDVVINQVQRREVPAD